MFEVVSTDEFDTWLRKLRDRQAMLRIVERIDRLSNGNPGDVKPVGQGISELRFRFGPGYRVYFLNDGNKVVLLLVGGDKSTQQKDISRARTLANEWRADQDEEDSDAHQ